ncbi:oligogalacturonate lyase family protein [Paenibacillus radicis (ex Xue et al. 2023)]|uniref:Oligogalacturonate lyase family protein n=1 Tax=Paenibacillus radicis (ex Xue et al. 2023) TaxID=2972489 RepID=A0ABT1YHG9_9BACL|nr:oligogalacturonate lyase family protein [Paenibacillus radicis (ex Xue et al. 2023)]MCR8632165.1 oligogalacturonate lyase family protein [Paenibacillus radicis (ex Xue et al. 2023)]
MIGQTFQSEKKSYKDEKTGRLVWQLTSNGSNNYHLYFTDNSFTLGDQEIYFLSDRSSESPEVYNFFKMDIASGLITQVTDEKQGIKTHTKCPDSELLVYTTGNTLKKVNTRTLQSEVIYEERGNVRLGSPFISPCKKYTGVIRNENVNIERGANYSGFKESMYSVKKAWITLVNMDGSAAVNVWEDTHYLGHFQFSPDDSTIAMFCHEGPWNLVHQRMWLLDTVSRSVTPCFRQGEDDCVGHEFWTRDGMIFFDNRKKGHDGTITSDRTQATVHAEPEQNQVPYVGLANKKGEVIRTIELPYYCNHYHANNDNSLLVGDDVDDLVLIRLDEEKPAPVPLCTHKTSWYNNRRHAHPTFSWTGRQILFASDRENRNNNLYLIDLD